MYSGNSGCTRTRCLYSGKVVVFGQKWLFSGKWLYLGESGCIPAKVAVIG